MRHLHIVGCCLFGCCSSCFICCRSLEGGSLAVCIDAVGCCRFGSFLNGALMAWRLVAAWRWPSGSGLHHLLLRTSRCQKHLISWSALLVSKHVYLLNNTCNDTNSCRFREVSPSHWNSYRLADPHWARWLGSFLILWMERCISWAKIS